MKKESAPLIDCLERFANYIKFNQTDRAYRNYYDYVLKHGIDYFWKDLSSSETRLLIATLKYFTEPALPKQCFYNAQRLVLLDTTNTIQYVEGYIMYDRIEFPILHAWNTINNKIVDITLRDSKNGKFISDNCLYVGIEFNKKLLSSKINYLEKYDSVLDDYSNKYPILKTSLEHSNSITYEELINL